MKAERKAELIKRIRELPGLNDDDRADLIALLTAKNHYGLVWEDKPEDVEERLRDELPVLVEDDTKRLNAGGDDAPNHVLIEGDNLEALTALAYTHAGKIDVIYIDPPYNTGNKDFVYNDSFVDSEDSYRHSKWLSFMSKRLRIAKKLLSDRGVIFISIDDNEQANLKLLCDEIFSAKNFLGLITRKQSSGAKNDTGENRIITTADYVVAYAKEGFEFKPYFIENKKNYSRKDDEGDFSPRALEMQGGGDTLVARPKMGYSVYYRKCDNKVILLFDYDLNNDPVYDEPNKELLSKGFVCYRPRKRDMALGRWRWGDETFMEKFNANLVHFEKGRVFIKERAKSSIPKYPEAIWDDYLNTLGTNELKEILGGKLFSFPKPKDFIAQLIRVTYSSTVLDFFAGSGTTMHAVMQLNAEDGGKRKCILVTNNENGICENVTYERNKRVINGYTKPNGDAVEGLHANNLRYYRTAFVSREPGTANRRKLVELSTDMLCIKEDIYTEQPIILNGKKLRKTVTRHFAHGGREMLVIYDERAVSLIVLWLQEREPATAVKVYVFSDGAYAYDDDFAPVAGKVELCALPEAILQAYKHVLPKRKVSDTLPPTPSNLEGEPATASHDEGEPATASHDEEEPATVSHDEGELVRTSLFTGEGGEQ